MLPFLVGFRTYAIPYFEVSRVTLPVGVAAIARYPLLPPCVVGVGAGESEMLTIVDSGLLFGSTAIQNTMKTRLIVMSEGALKGIALLVSRVFDMAPLGTVQADKEIQISSADVICQSLGSMVTTNRELKK